MISQLVSVSRSTTEAEIVSLTFSLSQEGLPPLTLWERLLGRPVELVLHEDNQATMLVAKKGYSPKMRHIQRTHKVNLSALAEQLEPGTGVVIKYVATDLQAADIFTKALQLGPRSQAFGHQSQFARKVERCPA